MHLLGLIIASGIAAFVCACQATSNNLSPVVATAAKSCEGNWVLVSSCNFQRFSSLFPGIPTKAEIRDVWQYSSYVCVNFRILNAQNQFDYHSALCSLANSNENLLPKGTRFCNRIGDRWLSVVGEKGTAPEYYSLDSNGISKVPFAYTDTFVAMSDPGLVAAIGLQEIRVIRFAVTPPVLLGSMAIDESRDIATHPEGAWLHDGKILLLSNVVSKGCTGIYSPELRLIGELKGAVCMNCVLAGDTVPIIRGDGDLAVVKIDEQGQVEGLAINNAGAAYAFAPSPDGRCFVVIHRDAARSWSIATIQADQSSLQVVLSSKQVGRPLGWICMQARAVPSNP